MEDRELESLRRDWVSHKYSEVILNDLVTKRNDAIKGILSLAKASSDVKIYALAKQIEACEMVMKLFKEGKAANE